MIEVVAKKTEYWVVRWGDVVLRPRSFFASQAKYARLSATEFFLGAQTLSFVVALATSLAYFMLFYREHIQAAVVSRAAFSIALTSFIFLPYALLNLVAILVAAILSFVVSGLFGSSAELASHFRGYLHLSPFEPLGSLGLTLFWIGAMDHRASIEHFGAVLFLLARLWPIIVGYWVLRGVHRRSQIRTWGLFLVGHIPGMLATSIILGGLGWGFLTMVVLGWD